VIRDVSQRKDLQKKILEIASDEQRRIGQELHDGTQQELTGLSLIAGTIEDFYDSRGRDANGDGRGLMLEHAELCRLMLSTSKLVKGLKEANQHVQSLSHGIMPVQIDAEGLQGVLICRTRVAGRSARLFEQTGNERKVNRRDPNGIKQRAISERGAKSTIGVIRSWQPTGGTSPSRPSK